MMPKSHILSILNAYLWFIYQRHDIRSSILLSWETVML